MKKQFFILALISLCATIISAQNLFHPEHTLLRPEASLSGVTGFAQEYSAACLAVASWKQHSFHKWGVFAYGKAQTTGESLGMLQFQAGPQFSYIRKKVFLTTGAGVGFGSFQGGLPQPRLTGYILSQTKPHIKTMKGADEVYARIEVGQGAPVVEAGICHYVTDWFAIGMAYRSNLHFPGPEFRWITANGLQVIVTASASGRVKLLSDADLDRFKGKMGAFQVTLRQDLHRFNDHKMGRPGKSRKASTRCWVPRG